jgi:hypothetical protein
MTRILSRVKSLSELLLVPAASFFNPKNARRLAFGIAIGNPKSKIA